MKTYNTPEIEIAKFERVNIVTDSLTIDPTKGHGSVGSRDRYDDDDEF